MSNATLLEAIANARKQIALKSVVSTGTARINASIDERKERNTFTWNKEQEEAITAGCNGESFCLIGAAGTGKTTTLRGLLSKLLSNNQLPPIEKSTRHLTKGSPGIVLFSYTRRAVRNIAKQMPPEIRAHCITGHKLLEFAPERFEVDDGKGGVRTSFRFAPSRNRANPLPGNLRTIVVDESSMVSMDFMNFLYDAIPNLSNVQFIFLGDLNQLPPVYGDAILGFKLLQLRTIELTEVYRQALESPIIDLAIQVKNGKMKDELKVITTKKIIETSRGKVTLHPWKQKMDQESAMMQMQNFLREWVRTDIIPNSGLPPDPLDFENDVILCPWNKAFGNIELNKAIATELALRYKREVYEVIAGYNKLYYSIGDRVLHEKRDAIITRIVRNSRYIGKHPQYHSTTMDYWGYTKIPTIAEIQSNEELDNLLDSFADAVEDRVQEASHALYLRYVDSAPEEEDTILSKAAEINFCELAYCMSVHKSQGSEWKRVIFITHDCHSKMLSREMTYTAITRASQELYMFLAPMALTKAANQPRIKGTTLKDKIEHFRIKHKEKNRIINDEEE